METFWLIVLIVLLGIWFLAPYLSWNFFDSRPLEAQVSRTSFACAPGELVPPAWKPPELSLSVVVPAFNEERRLPQMLDETFAYLEARASGLPGFCYEVIVVDDGSRDGTYGAALGSDPRRRRSELAFSAGGRGELRVLRLVSNRGKGFAVKAGMLVARGQLLLMADADGSTRIADLECMERALSPPRMGDPGVGIVFGSRHHLRSEICYRRSWLSNLVSLVIDMVVLVLVGGPIHDTQCGFKLFRADVGKRIFSSLHLSRWAFDLEVLVLSRMFCERVAEVPVSWVEMPGSKYHIVIAAPSMLRDIYLVQFLYFLGIWRPSAATRA